MRHTWPKMANRQNFSRAVKREIARRAVNAIGVPMCEHCFAVGVPLELHHKAMDAMQTPEKKRRRLTAADGEFLCRQCHRFETARQRVALAHVERVEANHWLPRPPSKMRSRNDLRSGPKDRPAMTKVCQRRPMFENAPRPTSTR